MAIIFPAKKYLTFGELLERWQCTHIDIRYLIVEGELKPSVKALQKMTLVQWDFDEDSDQFLLMDVEQDCQTGESIKIQPEGWFFLQKTRDYGPHECKFWVCTDLRDPDMPESRDPILRGFWYRLQDALTLEDVEKKAVFLLEEVLRFESQSQGGSPSHQAVDRPLHTKERGTLLTIIAALCNDVGYDHTKAAKTAGLIQGTAATMGVPIGETTIEGHLKQIPDALARRTK